MDFSVLICIYETYSFLFTVIFDQIEEPTVLEHDTHTFLRGSKTKNSYDIFQRSRPNS